MIEGQGGIKKIFSLTQFAIHLFTSSHFVDELPLEDVDVGIELQGDTAGQRSEQDPRLISYSSLNPIEQVSYWTIQCKI